MNIHDLSVFRTPKIYPETMTNECKCCIGHDEIPPGFGKKNLRHEVWCVSSGITPVPLAITPVHSAITQVPSAITQVPLGSSKEFIPISIFPITPVTPPLSRATTPIITPVLNTVTPTIVQGGPTNVQGEHVQKNPIIIPSVSRFGSLTLEHSEKTYTSQDFRSHARISIDKS